MKSKFKLILTTLCLICMFFVGISDVVYASEPTDKINDYTIEVTPQKDGTLDIIYHIEWEVLESDKAGELEWVKIGLPNKHYTNLKPLSDTIDHITTNNSGGTYANVYFKDSYEKGEVVTFDFSIHQSNMYIMNNPKEGQTSYSFTPGWFDEMEVENLTIRWYADTTENISPSVEYVDGAYVWNTKLDCGEKFTVNVVYESGALNFTEEGQYKEDSGDMSDGMVLLIIIVVIVVILFIIAMCSDDSYSSGSGLGGRSRTYIHTSGYRSSCVRSSCACACACACAGGGRAGCSMKDFYHTNVRLEQLKPKKK